MADLRVCVDGRMLAGPSSGVATYARAVVASLELAGHAPALLVERGSSSRRIRHWLGSLGGGARHLRDEGRRLVGPPAMFGAAQARFTRTGELTRIVGQGPPGTMHWTYPVPLLLEGWRNFYTVHDAIPLVRPDLTGIRAERHRRMLDALAAVATRFVTVSGSARDEIVNALGCAPGLVVDCGSATTPTPAPAGALPPSLVEKGYHLFCGAVEPRKNLVRLAQAHAAGGARLPLVIAGPDGWKGAEVRASLTAFPGVRLLGEVERPVLLALVASARALLFPSLAEGFGLPVLEAMQLGVPVLAAGIPALAEITGGAAVLVDPHDVTRMGAAIRTLEMDELLVERLRRLGRERGQAFTPERFGRRLLETYTERAPGDMPPR